MQFMKNFYLFETGADFTFHYSLGTGRWVLPQVLPQVTPQVLPPYKN